MQILNQSFYFFYALVILITLFGAIKTSVTDKTNPNPVYWTLALALMSISNIFIGLIPYSAKYFLSVANTTFIFSNIAISLLMRSWNSRLSKKYLYLFWSGFFVFLCVYEFAVFRHVKLEGRIFIISVISATLLAWALIELIKFATNKNENSVNLNVLKLIIFTQIILFLYRAYAVMQEGEVSTSGTLFNESQITALLRILATGLYLVLFIAIGNIYLERLWKKEQKRSTNAETKMLSSLNALALARDNETGNHIIRTQAYMKCLATALMNSGYHPIILNEARIENYVKAAPLHDLGKVGIPDDILYKAGPLSPEQWDIMKTHTTIGENVLISSQAQLEDDEDDVLIAAIEIAGSHHERWDGSGYPRGIKGEEIPLSARLMAIADMYDALVSERVYKKEWTHDEASKEIVRNKGKHFDPALVDAFIAERQHFKDIANKYKDN